MPANGISTVAAAMAGPPPAKPHHLEMPAGKPDLHHTRPRQPSHRCPITARQRPAATHRQPFHPHVPTPAAPTAIPQRQFATVGFAAPQHQSSVRLMVHQHAHETSPCQPTTGTNESTVADDSRLPNSPTIH
jgi:hypothetical protein